MPDKPSIIQRRLQKIRMAWKTALGRALSPVWSYLSWFVIKLRHGPMQRRDKVAIFLIFAPSGVPKSLFLTIAQVQRLGYAILFVVNGPLNPADQALLQAQSWRLLRRPNLGYDFGGYRDGLFHVLRSGAVPDHLLFLNDTFWCPASAGASSLTRLDGIQAPYAALCSFTYRPKGTRPTELVRRIYGCSFAFCVDSTVITSAPFQRYWRQMALYSAKEDVVRYGEVGFSNAMIAAGFMPKVVLDQQRVLDEIRTMSDEDVSRLFHLLPVLSCVNRELHADMVAQQQGEPQALRDLLLELASVMNPWDTYACYGLMTGQIDFIKKANFKNADNARRLLDMLAGNGVVLAEPVLQELQAYAAAG